MADFEKKRIEAASPTRANLGAGGIAEIAINGEARLLVVSYDGENISFTDRFDARKGSGFRGKLEVLLEGEVIWSSRSIAAGRETCERTNSQEIDQGSKLQVVRADTRKEICFFQVGDGAPGVPTVTPELDFSLGVDGPTAERRAYLMAASARKWFGLRPVPVCDTFSAIMGEFERELADQAVLALNGLVHRSPRGEKRVCLSVDGPDLSMLTRSLEETHRVVAGLGQTLESLLAPLGEDRALIIPLHSPQWFAKERESAPLRKECLPMVVGDLDQLYMDTLAQLRKYLPADPKLGGFAEKNKAKWIEKVDELTAAVKRIERLLPPVGAEREFESFVRLEPERDLSFSVLEEAAALLQNAPRPDPFSSGTLRRGLVVSDYSLPDVHRLMQRGALFFTYWEKDRSEESRESLRGLAIIHGPGSLSKTGILLANTLHRPLPKIAEVDIIAGKGTAQLAAAVVLHLQRMGIEEAVSEVHARNEASLQFLYEQKGFIRPIYLREQKDFERGSFPWLGVSIPISAEQRENFSEDAFLQSKAALEISTKRYHAERRNLDKDSDPRK